MADLSAITSGRFRRESEAQKERGLLGFIRCVVASLVVFDGIEVHYESDGDLALQFPMREDGPGRARPVIWLVDPAARREIDSAVFDARAPWFTP